MARRSRRAAQSPELPSPVSPPLDPLPTNRKRERPDNSMSGKDSPALALAAETSSPSKSNNTRKQQAKKRKQDKLAATENEQLQQALASSLEDAPQPHKRVDKGKAKALDQDRSQPESIPDSNLAALRKKINFKDTLIQNQTALLESLRTTIACTICLETLELPYSLACGHIFCRKCLLVWFHRVDVNADPAAADDSDDDVESVTSDIIIPPVVDESSSDDTSSDEAGAPPSKRQAMLNTLVKRPRQKTLQELADETTGSDSSDDKPSTSRPKSRSIHGTVGKHKFTVTGGDQTKIFSALEKAMYQMADSLSNGRGDKNIVEEGEAYRSSILGENTEAPSREQMRVARLARFGAEGGAVSTAVNAAAGPSGARSSPRLATAHQPSPPRRTRRIIIGESSDESPPPRRSPPPPPPANPPPIPTGEHRIKNLVCPHCRDAVDRAPIRIFVLSEIVSLIRAAEATGLVGLAASESHSTSTSAPLPGMVETDLSWGGLFDVIGAETKEQKKARRAVVMDDNEDGVRRCGNCNWEIDETNGICDGCGREWDLSEGEQSADSFRGDAFPLGTGYNSNEGRSADEEDSESDDGFVVESSPPAPARSRRPIILSDSDNGEPSASEGEVEVITRRTVKKKKPTIVESEEDDDEPVAVKSKPTKNRIVEIESDEEEKKESEGSGEEEGSDEEDDDEGEGVVRRTGSGGGFSSTEEWENDPDNYTRALSNSPEVDSEAAYREECW